jgi:hypothetical protein
VGRAGACPAGLTLVAHRVPVPTKPARAGVLAAGLAALGLAGPVVPAAAHAPAASAAAAAPVCSISDSRVTEVSGMVATKDGFVVVNDSNPDRGKERIFSLNDTCGVVRSVRYPTNALDPEDLAVAKDGTLWVADIGDNTPLSGGSGKRRSSIALWTLAPGSTKPVIHRYTYPDGVARDAESLLLNGDGTPVIVTKQPAGEVYVGTTTGGPLRQAGSFRPHSNGTANPLGFIGAGLVTGGAVSPDGSHAVVRTYADAYEFDVKNGDVAAAIATGEPRITPLPDEPQGESIAYSPDGASFYTCSDQPDATPILKYTVAGRPAAPAAATPSRPAASTSPSAAPTGKRLRAKDLPWLAAGLVVLIIAIVVTVRRSRRPT